MSGCVHDVSAMTAGAPSSIDGEPARARRPRSDRAVAAALLLVASVLALTRLGDAYLWQDEAQTALISRTVLTDGIPLGTDGRNEFSQEQGAEYGPGHVWRWHTWLPFYVLAGFFAVFGESTFVARLPFALFGIATVLLTWRLGCRLWREPRAAAAGAGVLALSVPFLVLVRQCRWYSMAAFFTVLALLGYVRLARGERGGGWLFLAGIVGTFHSHYFYAGLLLLTAAVHALWWHRRRPVLLRLLGWSAAAALACLPWIAWLATMEYGRRYGSRLFDPAFAAFQLQTYGHDLARHVAPPLLLAVPAAAALWLALRGRFAEALDPELWEPASLLLLFAAANLVALPLIAPSPFFRYLTPVLPCLALGIGRLAFAEHRFTPALDWGVGTFAVALVVLRQPLAGFAYELTHDYRGPIEGICRYLVEHGKPDDLVFTTYGDMPLKFYTGMRVVGGLTGADPSLVERADWVIVRQLAPSEQVFAMNEAVKRRLDPAHFQMIRLKGVPEWPYENSEEPELHQFRSPESDVEVIIARRIR